MNGATVDVFEPELFSQSLESRDLIPIGYGLDTVLHNLFGNYRVIYWYLILQHLRATNQHVEHSLD